MNGGCLMEVLTKAANECLNKVHVYNPKQYIRRIQERFQSIHGFEDPRQLETYIQQKYFKRTPDAIHLSPLLNELNIMVYFMCHHLYDLELHPKLLSSISTNTHFLQRTFIRLYLLYEGWNPISIERLLCTSDDTTLHKNDTRNIIIIYIFLEHICMKQEHEQTQQTRGRPRIPTILQPYFEMKRSIKNKTRMRKLYSKSKVFTSSDLQYLQTLLLAQQQEDEQVQTLLHKIHHMITLLETNADALSHSE